jgi:kexin
MAARKFNIYDPLWPKQWHLVNDVIQKHMINATGVWDMGITGKNVTVAIVDDGIDMTSDDLKDNFVRIPVPRFLPFSLGSFPPSFPYV